jgi:NADH:ubiquinone oxidoreductase subunit H
MQKLVDSLIASGTFGAHPPRDILYAIAIFVFSLVVFLGIAFPFAGIVSWVERRVWARMQSRCGPNRVGPNGFLQWLADGLKHVCKEDLVPAESDERLFKMAPYLVILAFTLPWAVMPFSSSLILADLNVGILYMTSVTALTVVGVLMAGWASNDKWSLIGGIRSAAQIVSYEIPAGLSIFPIVLLTGTLSMQGIIQAQGWAPWTWFAFNNPFTFIAANVLYISALAEGNRTPFDLPEAESELVAGFATEYSGMRYLFFFAVPGRMAVPARHQQSSGDERPGIGDLQRQGAVPGLRLDVGARHAAPGSYRSAHVVVLEVPGSDLVREHDWHRGVGSNLARGQFDRALDHARTFLRPDDCISKPRAALLQTLQDGALPEPDRLTARMR